MMGTATMGRVLVTARIENVEDLYDVKRGRLAPDQIRAVEVTDALVDARVRTLSLPPRLIALLGLAKFSLLNCLPPQYEPVMLTIQGRECVTYVDEADEDSPVRIGSIPCLAMDWVVDPKTNTLVNDPHPPRPLIYDLGLDDLTF
jgi:hypothetical protein